MKQWVRSRLWIYFSFLILIISLAIALAFIIVLFILEYFNLLDIFDSVLFLRWLIPIIVASIIGVSVSITVSHYILKPITHLKEAMNRVIESDFSIQLEEAHIIEEVSELYRSFNLMVKELKSIEHFQNNFTSMVSHEFKTPLSRIQGYAQLLNKPNLDPETRKKYQDHIIAGTKQLSSLTNNILSLAKLENQNIPTEITNVNLDEQIRESILLFQKDWEAKEIDLQIFLHPTTYYGNAALLMQIWSNLIDNAIFYSPIGGRIEIYLEDSWDKYVFSIKDQGPGITQNSQKHIFEQFYQGDSARNKTGAGLGLSIVKRIITLHNGTINFKTQVGQGTTFIVELPK